MTSKNVISTLIYIAVVGICIFIVCVVISLTWISHEVKNSCQLAKRQYSGDCVEALSQSLQDESQNIQARNDAIWALGQLGDIRALPVLEKQYTGIIPSREPLDRVISQYELKKAINLVSGGVNIGAWAWRWTVK